MNEYTDPYTVTLSISAPSGEIHRVERTLWHHPNDEASAGDLLAMIRDVAAGASAAVQA